MIKTHLFIAVVLVLTAGVGRCRALNTIMVRDYESSTPAPTVWVVHMPNTHASVSFGTDQPRHGRQCLQLRYQFAADGPHQYLGIPNPVKILMPVQNLRFGLRGDRSGCSYGVQITDAGGETHQYSPNTGQGGVIDFDGWKEVIIPLTAPHETWGGDKNGRLDYPVTAVTFTLGRPAPARALGGTIAFDTLQVDSTAGAVETLGVQIAVVRPPYGAEIRGPVPIELAAPGLKTLTVRCWQAGPGLGRDSTIGVVTLDARGRGSLTFPADRYPHGPITIRISGRAGSASDNCYLQLYNHAGKPWNAGLPPDPPAARGLTLRFADDFDQPLSIGSDPNDRYYDHKPPHGRQDFSHHRFAGYRDTGNPFRQIDTYLRIRASDVTGTAGLISSMHNDASGITARIPCYFECRFIAPNAIGSWPAFWLMTDYMTDTLLGRNPVPCDELDIIEAYGGEGHGHPNAFDSYMVTPHAWNQGPAGKALEKAAFEALRNPVRMKRFGIPSTWYEAFHTYGCRIDPDQTIYYCDNIEVGRHDTLPLCREKSLFFMINLATGGGWPVDLSRYGHIDMYIDFVRVYDAASPRTEQQTSELSSTQ